MSEHLKNAKQWLQEAGTIPTDEGSLLRLRWAMWEMYHHLEAQQETPASAETTSSSPATAPTVDGQSGSSTSSPTFSLVRTDHRGHQVLAFISVGHNSTLTVGDVLSDLRDGALTQQERSTLALQWPSGQTLSTIPALAPAGPTAGGSAPSPDPSPSAAAPSATSLSEDSTEPCCCVEWQVCDLCPTHGTSALMHEMPAPTPESVNCLAFLTGVKSREAKAARYEEALKRILDEEESAGRWDSAERAALDFVDIARDALKSPTPIAPGEAQG